MSRYGNKCVCDGITFDSESERDFYLKLKDFKSKNKIKDFEVNPTFTLQPSFETEYNDRFINSKEKPITYIVDYSVTLNSGDKILVDTKGGSGMTNEETAKIKRKLLSFQHKNIPIFFISKCPNYLSGGKEIFIENTNGKDFYSKLKNKYYKIHPEQKKKRGKKDIQWTIDDWYKYFEFDNIDDLFYVWRKTLRK